MHLGHRWAWHWVKQEVPHWVHYSATSQVLGITLGDAIGAALEVELGLALSQAIGDASSTNETTILLIPLNITLDGTFDVM